MKKLSLEKKIVIGIVLLFITIGAMFLVTNNKGEFSELKTELAMYEYNVENKFIVTNSDIEKLEKELENQKKNYDEKLEKYNKIIEDKKLKTDKKERNLVEEVKYKEELINNYLEEQYKELDFKKRTIEGGNEDEKVALGKINSELEKLAEAKFEELEIEQKEELLTTYQNQIKEYEKLKSVVENRIENEKVEVERIEDEKAEAERIAQEQANISTTNNTTSNTTNDSNNATNNSNNATNNTTNNNNSVTTLTPQPKPKDDFPRPAACIYAGDAGANQAQADGIASGRGWMVSPCGIWDGIHYYRLKLFDACTENCEGLLPEWS